MANTLQIKRGVKANLGTLGSGELAYGTDDDGIYIGDGAANHRATMDEDTDVSSNGWVINEDDLASDLDTKVPTQQSVKAYVANFRAPWLVIATGSYTATPTDTDTLAMSATAGMAVGLPLQYTIGGTVYRGRVVAVSADTSIDIQGAPMGGDVTKLEVGEVSRVAVIPMYVDSTYGNATDTDLLWNDMSTKVIWDLGKAYCIGFQATHKTVDTGTEPKVNVNVGGSAVSTNDTNNGIQLGATGVMVKNSAVAINTTNYSVDFGDAVTPTCTVAGGTGDAANLTVQAVFVLE